MDKIEIDEKLNEGKISKDTFKQLLDAEIYGTASPMQWLEKRLRLIESILKRGSEIEIESDDGFHLIKTPQEFHLWCQENFPGAFECFFSNQQTTR